MKVISTTRNRLELELNKDQPGVYVRTGAFLKHPDSRLEIPHKFRLPFSRISQQMYLLFRVLEGKFVLTTPYDDAELVECKLERGEILIVKLEHVLAFSDTMFFGRKWRLFDLNSLLSLQFRYLYFEGPGRLFLFSLGSFIVDSLQGKPADYDRNSVIGWSNTLNAGVASRSSSASALLSKEDICLSHFEGTGDVLLQASNVRKLPRRFNSPDSQTTFMDYLNAFLGLRI